MKEAAYFSETYDVARLKFRGLLERVQRRWPGAELKAVPAPPKDCTIDIISAPPKEKKRLLLITAGQHGIEGYMGSAFIQLLAREYIDKLQPEDTGLVLVHVINPWGMANFRRVNEINVDLNRNFIIDWKSFMDQNDDYPRLKFLLEPGKPKKGKAEEAAFYWRVLRALAQAGSGGIKRALTLGQYRSPQGLYYGGAAYQPVTDLLIEMYNRALAEYPHILHLDIHTGYGPASRMTVVNSALDPRNTSNLKKSLGYDLVVKADPEEFYAMQGDMVDYVNYLGQKRPEKHLYSTALEFGTLGDTFGAQFKSLRALIEENQLFQHGGRSTLEDEEIRKQFVEAFYPSSLAWRQQALADSRRVLAGILGQEGLL